MNGRRTLLQSPEDVASGECATLPQLRYGRSTERPQARGTPERGAVAN